MKIIILRHGEDKNNKLTLKGKLQVKLVAQQLKDFDIQNIYCSPLNRCIQTANIVSKKLGMPYTVEENLKERWQLGHTPNNSQEQEWWDNYLNKNYNSQTYQTCSEFLQNNFKIFEKIKKNGKNALIIAHSATSYALLDLIFNKKGQIVWTKFGHANYICIEI